MFQVRTSSHSDIVEIEGQEGHTQAIDWTETQTFWLNAANIGVGVATLSCFAALGYGLAKDLRDGIRRRRASHNPVTPINDDVFKVPGLGLTMADGGEPIKRIRLNKSK